jgi:hypothetical protein
MISYRMDVVAIGIIPSINISEEYNDDEVIHIIQDRNCDNRLRVIVLYLFYI